MDYRDERDALQGRVQNLEEDLAAAKAQAQKTEQLEHDLERAQQEIARIHGELKGAQLPPAPRRPSAGRVLVVMCVAVMVSAGVAGFLLVGVRTRSIAKFDPPRNAAIEPPSQAPVAVAPGEVAPSTSRVIDATWSGKVKSATGGAIAVGAPCSIRAQIQSDGASPNIREIQVDCGGQPLYRLSDALEGSSLHSAAVEEMPGTEAGKFRYSLRFEDQGTRTGARNQTSINTSAGVAAAWKDTMPTFRVELLVDETSAELTGAPLFTASSKKEPTFRVPVDRGGRVTEVTAGAPVPRGAACALHIRPALDPKNDCRALIRCGDVDLYGARAGGFNQCQYEAGQPVAIHDPRFTAVDSDPALELDLKTGHATVSDQTGTPGETWSVTVAFETQKR